MSDLRGHLRRWPLLLVGITVVGLAIGLFGDREDPSDARALLLGIGSMLMGAGTVLVVLGWKDPGGPDEVDGEAGRGADAPGV